MASYSPALVINDVLVLRQLKHYLLEQAGFEVEDVEDGMAALALLRSCRDPYLVVFNTRMPLVDGTAFLRAVAAEPATLQRHAYVLTTALARMLPAELERLVRQFDVPVLNKPFSHEDFFAAVAQAKHTLDARQQNMPPHERIASA
jgi:CheY-like chemotaxis protein